jgi:hypothetical protein
MRKPISTELCTERPPLAVEHQPIHEHPSVIIGCNPRRSVEALGTIDTGSCLQNPQYVPLRDAVTILSPLSVPQMSGKSSEKGGKQKQDVRTFENDRIFGAPKVAKRPRDLVRLDMYKFRFISENVECVGMLKILGRVDSETVPICVWRCREFCIKMRVIPKRQVAIPVRNTVKAPQNFLKSWIVTN